MRGIRGPAYFLAEAVKARAKDLRDEGKSLRQAVEEISVELYRAGRGEKHVPLTEVRIPVYPGSLRPAEESLQQTLGSLGVRAILVLALERVYPDIVTHLLTSRRGKTEERKTEERPKILEGLRNIVTPWVSEEYGGN